MNILITGSTGFIGQHLAIFLSKTEHKVVCAIRESSRTKTLDKLVNTVLKVVDFKDKRKLYEICQGVDIIIHLAGQLGIYGIPYSEYYDVNCKLTKELAETAAEAGIKQFIYCSTPGVLGFGKRLAIETAAYAPRNDYEKTKMIAEQIVKDVCGNNPNMKYTIIRPDFVYGPGDIRRVKMYKGIMKKRFILTTSGNSYLHPTYIDDVVKGFIMCLGNENAYNETFNIAAKQDITSGEYLGIIASCTKQKLIKLNIGIILSHFLADIIDFLYRKLLNKEGFVSKNKIDFLAVDHSSSIKKATEKLGYKPQYSCKEGIELTIKWCHENNLI